MVGYLFKAFPEITKAECLNTKFHYTAIHRLKNANCSKVKSKIEDGSTEKCVHGRFDQKIIIMSIIHTESIFAVCNSYLHTSVANLVFDLDFKKFMHWKKPCSNWFGAPLEKNDTLALLLNQRCCEILKPQEENKDVR